NLQRADEVLFDEPVLCCLEYLRIGQDRLASGEEHSRFRRYVLEFIGDDVDRARKTSEGDFVVISRTGARVHDIECAGVLFGRVHVATQTQRRRREGEHASELAAAKDTDGRAGL